MKLFLIGFLLMCVGFVIGFITAALCCAAGRGEEQDEIMREALERKGGAQ